MEQSLSAHDQKLGRYLSPVTVWALSFGCAVGWGSFVMPGTTFLPKAGPLGTLIGMVIGAIVMFIIGMNYHYLMNKYPDAGGTLTYATKILGYDHGYLSSWFLVLVYIAIIWANATALALIARNLMGDTFQFGFHYTVLGYDVYLGEVLLTLAALLIAGYTCMKKKRVAVGLQLLCAIILFGGVIICAGTLMMRGSFCAAIQGVNFAEIEDSHISQVLTIMALSPWAFVGFESISNSVEGFTFNPKKSIWIMAAALFSSAMIYVMLNNLAVSVIPEGYAGWNEYIKDLGNNEGLAGLPTFYAVSTVMGKNGVLVLGLAALSGIMTGLIGNFIAVSRLLYSMAEEDILPKWFAKLNSDGSPENAFYFLIAISSIIPFLGRTAIGWIVDVNTVGATIAYAYTSIAAFVAAKRESDKKIQFTGFLGIAMSVFFFFYFMSWSTHTMSTESYLILATWSVLGFVYFRHVFDKDKDRRFGKSTVVWIGLLFLIFFTSLMWVNQANEDLTKDIIKKVSEHYEEIGAGIDPDLIEENEEYLEEMMDKAERTQVRNSYIQMALILVSLAIMFSIYMVMSKRQKEAELEKIVAEENSKAKSTFLSNMSHDIRTPMNAIIGYVTLAQKDGTSREEVDRYLEKIEGASTHLLALINDTLEMSRIESGKIELEEIPTDLGVEMESIKEMFDIQMLGKKIDYVVDYSKVRDRTIITDKTRFNRVLLNLIGNAYKFTPEGGGVHVKLTQYGSVVPDWLDDESEKGPAREYYNYELRVKDTGIGMSDEFAEHVFEAFEREKTSTVSGIQGTGLGMAITKSIIDMMHGKIDVLTFQGEGTEFVITIPFAIDESAASATPEEKADSAVDFSKLRVLLVEDMAVNREIATMLLKNECMEVESAENGQLAVDMVAAHQPGFYDVVFMDIQMPVMDGYEATQAIRNLQNPGLAKVPILAMTANAFSEDVAKATEAGMDGHISKPIDINVIKETLSQVL